LQPKTIGGGLFIYPGSLQHRVTRILPTCLLASLAETERGSRSDLRHPEYIYLRHPKRAHLVMFDVSERVVVGLPSTSIYFHPFFFFVFIFFLMMIPLEPSLLLPLRIVVLLWVGGRGWHFFLFLFLFYFFFFFFSDGFCQIEI